MYGEEKTVACINLRLLTPLVISFEVINNFS